MLLFALARTTLSSLVYIRAKTITDQMPCTATGAHCVFVLQCQHLPSRVGYTSPVAYRTTTVLCVLASVAVWDRVCVWRSRLALSL